MILMKENNWTKNQENIQNHKKMRTNIPKNKRIPIMQWKIKNLEKMRNKKSIIEEIVSIKETTEIIRK